MYKRDVRKDYAKLLIQQEWREFSQRQIEAAGNQCKNCGAEENLRVHHQVYYASRLPWEYGGDEVRVLCRDCHESIHSVADLIWIQCLRFEPHELESILKGIGGNTELIRFRFFTHPEINPPPECMRIYRVSYRHKNGKYKGYDYFEKQIAASAAVHRAEGEGLKGEMEGPFEIEPNREGVLKALQRFGVHPNNG
jgi:hypothetical protein